MIGQKDGETHEEYLSRLKKRNLEGMELGVKLGWWESFDDEGPIPFPTVLNKVDIPEKFMSQLLVRLGVFPSVREARLAGWNNPVECGEFWFKKRKMRIQII